jgi:hypothetical protein
MSPSNIIPKTVTNAISRLIVTPFSVDPVGSAV